MKYTASIKDSRIFYFLFVESGIVILIGATTENPYFEVNEALISRSIIFELKPLTGQSVKTILLHAIEDRERGLGAYQPVVSEEALDFLSDTANGDARIALNALELGVLSTLTSEDGKVHINLKEASECIQKRPLQYDKAGDNHYDTVSAFIKSMRGSDPDAAVYYLARMLEAGEDIKFIARRIMICASEDVSNADPQALILAVSAAQAVERLGMPEARIVLAQVVAYVACAPKSNSAYKGIDKALTVVKKGQMYSIPSYLKDTHYKGAKNLLHGISYQYSHEYPNHYSGQLYLPEELRGTTFYQLSDMGYEKRMKEWQNYLRQQRSNLN